MKLAGRAWRARFHVDPGAAVVGGHPLEFRILGPLEVSDAGSALPIGGPRHRVLLAVLLVHACQVVSTGRLIEALWGEEPPRSAADMLYVRICELRKVLRAEQPGRDAVLLTCRSGYVLQVGADELDAHWFERLAGEGAQALACGDPETAAGRLREALALWRGPALADVADRPFAQVEIARLEGLRLQALEARLHADLALERHSEIIGELEALVGEHPLREHFWGQLMLALYRADRQGDALRAYQVARELLVEQLGIEPGGELQRLQAAILHQDPALAPSAMATEAKAPATPNNLPVGLTTFIGRDLELTEVQGLLATARLVTLTGVGGVGKSRLALEVAAAVMADHPHGVWLIELAPLAEPTLVVPTVATALGVRERPERPLVDLLVERLRTAQALLVLDNCEHLVAEVAEFVQRLLGACPRLRILATSRERLGIIGEVLRPVSGLAVPEPGATSAAAVGRAEATWLLVERAAAVQPGFDLSDATAGAVAQICRRLDGLPLAIELAAARVNALGVEQIVARLDDRFRLLTGGSRTALPRHQTLRAVVEWSYRLLGEPQRRLFDRLAVFVDGFTLESAEDVAADPDGQQVSGLLARLVDKSLVTAEMDGATMRRYRLLETLRDYGLQRLQQRGEVDRLRARHAGFFLALAEQAFEALRGPDQPAWLVRLEAEHGNLRAALDWSLSQSDAETAVRLAGSLYQFWDIHGHYTEGRRWLAQALAADGEVPAWARARALLGVATLAVIQGDLPQAVAACEEAATLCRNKGGAAGLSHALQYRGFIAICTGELDQAAALLDESLQLARATDVGWLEGWSLIFMATVELARGDPDRAAELADECEAVLRPVGDREGIAWALLIRGAAAWRRGDHPHATAPLRAGLQAFQSINGLWGLALGLHLTAQCARARGHWHRSARLFGASQALHAVVGAALTPFVKAWLDEAVAEVSAALGAAGFQRAWEVGPTLPLDAAVDEAVQELDLSFPP